MTTTLVTGVTPPHAHPFWRRALFTREAAVIGLLAVVIVAALIVVPNFDSPLTVTYMLREIAPILLIALPMTLIIVTEEIDLSVASVVGLSSVLTGMFVQAGLPLPVAAVLAIAAGAVCGAINGFLSLGVVARLRLRQRGGRQPPSRCGHDDGVRHARRVIGVIPGEGERRRVLGRECLRLLGSHGIRTVRRNGLCDADHGQVGRVLPFQVFAHGDATEEVTTFEREVTPVDCTLLE